MDYLKAILNQILLFFDDVGERVKRLPSRGRRRVMLLAGIFLMLVILLMILCIASCHSTGEAVTAEAVRTRVRGSVVGENAEPDRSGELMSVSSEVLPVSDPNQPSVTWPPTSEPETIPTDDPFVEPEETPDAPVSPEQTPEAVVPSDPESTDEPETKYDTLKKHDKSEAVATLQYRLMELGYLDIDEPTNYFGSSTESALILFQRQHDLKQDGIAGSETQAVLYSETAEHYCLKEGAEGQDVKALQEQLVELGYLSEKEVDRVYGPVTISAVQAFQKRNGLHVDGLAGEKTLELLYSDSAKISKELLKKQEAEAAAKKKAEEEAKKKAEEEAKKKANPTKSSSGSNKGKKTPTPKPKPTPTPTPKRDTRIDKFIAAANSKIGCEYVLGAKGPNKFDCSGLVYYCLKQAGVEGTRLNAAGYSQKSGWTKISSINSLKKGDILFFRSDTNSSVNHTGIYVGYDTMIDASSGNGKVVKRPLSAYWKRNFVCARRPWRD